MLPERIKPFPVSNELPRGPDRHGPDDGGGRGQMPGDRSDQRRILRIAGGDQTIAHKPGPTGPFDRCPGKGGFETGLVKRKQIV